MDTETMVEIADVESLYETGIGLLCRAKHDTRVRLAAVPVRHIRAGSTIGGPYQQGHLVIPDWLAVQLGLTGEPAARGGFARPGGTSLHAGRTARRGGAHAFQRALGGGRVPNVLG